MNKVITTEEKEDVKRRHEKLAGYFFDMSKLTFATTVLGGLAPMFKNASLTDFLFVILGIAFTATMAEIGNIILKKK